MSVLAPRCWVKGLRFARVQSRNYAHRYYEFAVYPPKRGSLRRRRTHLDERSMREFRAHVSRELPSVRELSKEHPFA